MADKSDVGKETEVQISDNLHDNNAKEEHNDSVKEGTHAIYLRKAIDSTINKCIASVKLRHFITYYSNVKDKNKARLVEAIYKQFKNVFLDTMEEEVNLTYEEENIVPLLNELNRLSEEAPNEPGWRPSGVAEDDVRAHLMAVKIRHRDKLKAMAKEFDKETAKLKAQVLPSRKRITETKNQIQEKKLKLASSLEELPNKDIEDLLKELGASKKYVE